MLAAGANKKVIALLSYPFRRLTTTSAGREKEEPSSELKTSTLRVTSGHHSDAPGNPKTTQESKAADGSVYESTTCTSSEPALEKFEPATHPNKHIQTSEVANSTSQITSGNSGNVSGSSEREREGSDADGGGSENASPRSTEPVVGKTERVTQPTDHLETATACHRISVAARGSFPPLNVVDEGDETTLEGSGRSTAKTIPIAPGFLRKTADSHAALGQETIPMDDTHSTSNESSEPSEGDIPQTRRSKSDSAVLDRPLVLTGDDIRRSASSSNVLRARSKQSVRA